MKKNILIVTQTVDEADSNLGFFCGWVREFASHSNNIYVVANKVGAYSLPNNVKVFSLGKENNKYRAFRFFRYWYLLFRYLPKVDGVFVHMAPEYVVYGGWLARLYGKKLSLWYVHKSVTWRLRLALLMVNSVFTASLDGISFVSKKIKVVGHGIDLEALKVERKLDKNVFNMLTVGRISPSKNLLILLKTVSVLASKINKKLKLTVVGSPYLKKDFKYLDELKSYIKNNEISDLVDFVGSVPHEKIGLFLAKADVFVSASNTGGVDKAVLEPVIVGVPTVTSNRAFVDILPASLLFEAGNVEELVEKLVKVQNIDMSELQHEFKLKNNLSNTIKKIIEYAA